jgi:hypothetical protein
MTRGRAPAQQVRGAEFKTKSLNSEPLDRNLFSKRI